MNGRFILAGQGSSVDFYLISGIGPTLLSIDAMTLTDIYGNPYSSPGINETDFALRLGLGIDVKAGEGLALYFEANSLETFTSRQFSMDGYIDSGYFSIGLKIDP